ncbi:MSMEG_0570 family nitrogen starvation response protein [Alteromonas sp. 5E99-2]|uniref:MSMEG_0570 family nitrogen starvation response protein n=1 Tax=Alteromonas sp. 5E99-2 TaxID=2817683 RepID=UPI001A97E058|nr:MSMEG_0570 family nitrogen starvation response protein [Alteromonas sp. 5E99-2]MBO1255504.1 MSMEG_0570 family nitrogen starvation response protein [Alteromonas sp. 5E99-2]
MPEKHFVVQWPNGEVESCYSPSSVITEYFHDGQSLSIQEFLEMSEKGLNHASERVRQSYGFSCSSAMDQLQKIKTKAAQFDQHDAQDVRVIKVSN